MTYNKIFKHNICVLIAVKLKQKMENAPDNSWKIICVKAICFSSFSIFWWSLMLPSFLYCSHSCLSVCSSSTCTCSLASLQRSSLTQMHTTNINTTPRKPYKKRLFNMWINQILFMNWINCFFEKIRLLINSFVASYFMNTSTQSYHIWP